MCARTLVVFAGLIGGLSSATAGAQTLRYEGVLEGGVAITGNTLGLSKAANTNGPGISSSIGTFITTDALSVDSTPAPGWGAGTTSDWAQNRSAGAPLVLPAGATVVYAELVWGGTYDYGAEDVSAFLDTSVSLAYGTAATPVTPDPATSATLDLVAGGGFDVQHYVRSADVTSFVAAHGAGTYSVGGVPATQDTNINTLNAAGWSLFVVFGDPASPMRAVSVSVGAGFVEDVTSFDISTGAFCAPDSGPVNARVFAAAIGGDAPLTGDTLGIAPTALDTFEPLSDASNPETNFFASQIDGDAGALATGGTFGTSNHDAAGATNASGARQGWDLASVEATSGAGQLQNGQTSAVLRFATTGDAFVTAAAAFAIDLDAPNLDPTAAIDVLPAEPLVGEILGGTLTLTNTGTSAADATLALDLPDGFELLTFLVAGNAASVDTAALEAGVPLGLIASNGTLVITFSVETESAASGTYVLSPVLEYEFASCSTAVEGPLTLALASSSVTLSDPSGGDDDDDGGGAGCGCSTTAPSRPPLAAWMLALGIAVFVRRASRDLRR